MVSTFMNITIFGSQLMENILLGLLTFVFCCRKVSKAGENRVPAILHPRWSADDSSCCWPLLPVEQQNGYQNHTQSAWQLPVWKPTLEAKTLFGNFLYFQRWHPAEVVCPAWAGLKVFNSWCTFRSLKESQKNWMWFKRNAGASKQACLPLLWPLTLRGSKCPSPQKRKKPDVNGKCLWRCLEVAAM